MAYEIHIRGGAENHKAVRKLFETLVRESRKFDSAADARFYSVDGSVPDHVEHPDGGFTGENPQIQSGNQDTVDG